MNALLWVVFYVGLFLFSLAFLMVVLIGTEMYLDHRDRFRDRRVDQ